MTYVDLISEILFVVVLYKKKIAECESLVTLEESVDGCNIDVFIYDNSPDYNLNVPETIGNCRIHYLGDLENPGVSKAYNSGAVFAKKTGKKWLILCDQDTLFQDEFFMNLYAAISNFNPVLLAPFLYSNSMLISPCGFRLNYGYPLKLVPRSGFNKLNGISLLNSGLTVSLEAYMNCGGYNEKVFLDFADFDFIKRFKKICPTFYLLDVKLEHHLESTRMQAFNKERFIKYCKSYRGAITNLYNFVTLSLIVTLRTIKLALVHQKLIPIKIFLLYYVADRNR
ncbi:MAG: glycosyltransferase [Bacteroidales bacterium]|nr:glycosyltransferase [Bacteroidales bacterium]